MNPNLKNQIEQLGILREQRKELEAREALLYRSVVGQMSEHDIERANTDNFVAILVRQQKLTVRPAAFARLVSKKELIESVSVSVTRARRFLGEKKLLGICDVAESLQLRIAPREPAENTRRHENTAELGAG